MKVTIFNKIIFENKIILLMIFIAIEVVAKFKHEIARGAICSIKRETILANVLFCSCYEKQIVDKTNF